MVSALSLVAGEQGAQAQLAITVNPLQGDSNRTVWTFTGSSAASRDGSIQIGTGNIGLEGAGQLVPYALQSGTPVPPSTELIPAGNQPSSFGNYALSFSTNVNFQPRITISNNTRTISHIFLQNFVGSDYVGIRVSGAAPFSYNTNAPVSWRGRGILPYSITNLTTTAAGEYFYNAYSSPYFAARGTAGTPASGGLRVVVSSTPVVPEPEEYALVFGLFALGFVVVRRYFQKKRRQPAATSDL